MNKIDLKLKQYIDSTVNRSEKNIVNFSAEAKSAQEISDGITKIYPNTILKTFSFETIDDNQFKSVIIDPGNKAIKSLNSIDFENGDSISGISDEAGDDSTIALSQKALIDVQEQLDNKADKIHTHEISDVIDLQTELDGKADSNHDHEISDVNNLQTTLTNHENLISTKADESMLTALAARVAIVELGKADTNHSHVAANITDLQNLLDGYAAANHNHDSSYSAINHTHNEYAAANHNHDSSYSAINHNHNEYVLKELSYTYSNKNYTSEITQSTNTEPGILHSERVPNSYNKWTYLNYDSLNFVNIDETNNNARTDTKYDINGITSDRGITISTTSSNPLAISSSSQYSTNNGQRLLLGDTSKSAVFGCWRGSDGYYSYMKQYGGSAEVDVYDNRIELTKDTTINGKITATGFELTNQKNYEYIFTGDRCATWQTSGNQRYKKCILGYFSDPSTTSFYKVGFIKVAVVSTSGNYGQKEYLLYIANSGTTYGTKLECVSSNQAGSGGSFNLMYSYNNNRGVIYLCCDGYSNNDGIGCQITASLPARFRLYDDMDLTTLTGHEKTLTWIYSSTTT